jgi:hypothetical protein
LLSSHSRSHTFWHKIANYAVFCSKVLNKIYSKDVLWGIYQFLKYLLLKALWSYTCSKFRESYMPPAGLGLIQFKIKCKVYQIMNICLTLS